MLAKEDPAGVASFRTAKHQRTAMTVLVDRLTREERHETKVWKFLIFPRGWICNLYKKYSRIMPLLADPSAPSFLV